MDMPLYGNFEMLVQELHLLGTLGFPCDEVSELLKKLSLTDADISPYTFFKPGGYARNLIYHDAKFEALLLCWGPGHVSPVHGHEGEKCWMRVVQGTLEFTNYKDKSLQNPDDLVVISTMAGGPGFVDGPAYIHKVAHVGSQPAMSLHLYARPFAQCDVYDTEVKKRRRVDLAYDTMYGNKVDRSLVTFSQDKASR